MMRTENYLFTLLVCGSDSDTLPSWRKSSFYAHAHRSEALLKALNLFLRKQRLTKGEGKSNQQGRMMLSKVQRCWRLTLQHISLLLDNEGRSPTF